MASAPRRGGRLADLSAKARSATAEALARTRARTAEALARRRVALGFVCGAVTLALAQPTAGSIVVGMSIAAVGEALRVWAAGHLNKAREVTSSGPYRWLPHPLYAGSSIMGVGLAIACANVLVTALIAIYLIVTMTAAIRNEEAFLRRAFGDRYDRYRRGGAPTGSESGAARRFTLAQAIANREHRAIAGLLVAMLLLVLKATYNGSFWRGGG
jgi:protein-S-isoprenylcysteine O-methyltransferase Ste14